MRRRPQRVVRRVLHALTLTERILWSNPGPKRNSPIRSFTRRRAGIPARSRLSFLSVLHELRVKLTFGRPGPRSLFPIVLGDQLPVLTRAKFLPCIVLGNVGGESLYKTFRRSIFMWIGSRALIVALVMAGNFGCSKNVSISETKGGCADIHQSQVCTDRGIQHW